MMLAHGACWADEKPPHIAWLFPAGGQRGKTVEVTVGGADLAGATAIRITGKGVDGQVLAGAERQDQDAQAVGRHRGRCRTRPAATFPSKRPPGMSNWFHFLVGQLPEVNEAEPNDDPAKAQPLPLLPVLVNGQFNPQAGRASDRDCFRFEAKAGQTLVFAVDARPSCPT